jgi:hypothetical protein
MPFNLNLNLRSEEVDTLIQALELSLNAIGTDKKSTLRRLIELVKRASEDEDYADQAVRKLLNSLDHSLDPATIKDTEKLIDLGFPQSMIKNLAAALTKIVKSYDSHGGNITRDEAATATTVQDLVNLIKSKMTE